MRQRIEAMSFGLPGKIFIDMRDDIIKGAYPVGGKLPPERELSSRYGASRFAVREAIAMLTQGGFVETLPQSGTYVRDFEKDGTLETLVQILRIRRSIDRQTLDSLLSFRYATETIAAGEAAALISESDLDFLGRNLERKEQNLSNIPALTECDYEFHYTIISISKNIISRLVFQSFRPIYSFFTEFFYSIEGAPASSLKLNRRLLHALRRGDADASRKAMGDILKFGEKKVYQAIRQEDRVILL